MYFTKMGYNDLPLNSYILDAAFPDYGNGLALDIVEKCGITIGWHDIIVITIQ